MTEPISTFPEELQEVLGDVRRESWHRMSEIHEAAKRFFFAYADAAVSGPLGPEEKREDVVATVLIFVFMAGREHALRGYRPPFPREVPPGEMPKDLEDEIERMRDDGHF